MNGKQLDTYVTRVRNRKICEIMNQPGFGIPFDNKLLPLLSIHIGPETGEHP